MKRDSNQFCSMFPILSAIGPVLAAAVVVGSASAGAAVPQRFLLVGDGSPDAVEVREVSSQDISVPGTGQWSVRTIDLEGGKQDGVQLIELNNGAMTIRVVPTRGMNILDVTSGDLTLGWDSPVKEVVHPKYINLESRGGLGWLEGFNEWMARCGLEFAGHPGMDQFITNTGEQAEMNLTVHGKISNIPASRVELVVDAESGTLTVRGVVHERMFFGPKLELVSEISTKPGSREFTIHDVVTNHGAGPQEMQLIYHCNFGQPLLEQGSRVHVPVDRIAPMNDHAAESIDQYATYAGPTAGFIEQVYLVHPRFDGEGRTHALIRNAEGTRGCSLSWNKSELPYFTLWKNTTAFEDGYVTGLEPATGFPYNRSVERKFGRVPKLRAGESRSFTVTVTLHPSADSVQSIARQIEAIQGDEPATVERQPPYEAE